MANGHGAWEGALTNMLSRGDKVLVLESGRFAAGWGNAAAFLGAEVETLQGDWRRAVRPAEVEARLREDKARAIKAILVAHIDMAGPRTVGAGRHELVSRARALARANPLRSLFNGPNPTAMVVRLYTADEYAVRHITHYVRAPGRKILALRQAAGNGRAYPSSAWPHALHGERASLPAISSAPPGTGERSRDLNQIFPRAQNSPAYGGGRGAGPSRRFSLDGHPILAPPEPRRRGGRSHMRHMATCEMLAFPFDTAAHDIRHPALPWVGDGESLTRPGMLDTWFRKPVVREPRRTVPRSWRRWLRRLSDRRQRSTSWCQNATSARLFVGTA
jgi:hypothetical protein